MLSMYIVLHKKGNKMITGSFVPETIKVFSFLVVVSFPTIEECNQVQDSLYGDKPWFNGDEQCFTTYKELPLTLEMPLDRPDNLGEFPIEDR